MEILGVGVPELMFIVLIALILLGPKDMIAAGRTFGKFLRQFLTSPTWQAMRKTGEELQQLPTKLVREAGLEDLQKEVQSVTNTIKQVDLKKTFDEASIFDPSKDLVIPDEPAKTIRPSVPLPPSPPKDPEEPSEPSTPKTTE
jgi:sec-independent protein translocase protein TatB